MIPSKSETTRRAALRQFAQGAGAAVAVFPILGQNPPPENHHRVQPVTKQAAAYKYRFFSPQQLETLDALGETIIPADDHSPGAKAAHVSEYIDAVVSSASPRIKTLWTDGIASIERATQQRFGVSYVHCSPDQQTIVLTVFAETEESAVPGEDDFFQALKRATVDGYYTSPIGIFQDLQYQGNEALPFFTGCQHTEHQ